MRTNYAKTILRIIVGAIAMIALTFMANTTAALAGGPDATPTPVTSVGSGVYTTTQTAQVTLLQNADRYALVDCLVYDNILIGFQSVVGEIKKSHGVTILDRSADGIWAQVTDGTSTGWTLATNLNVDPPVTARAPQNACSGTSCGSVAPVSVTITDGGSTATKCVVVDGLNRRTAAGTWNPVAGSAMARGTQVTLTGRRASNGWVQVETPGGIIAWVNGSSQYLGACGSTPIPAPAQSSTCVESEVLSFSPRLRELNGEVIFDAEDLTSGSFQALLFDGQHVDWPGRDDDGAAGTDGELDTRIQLFGSYVAEYFYRQGTWYRVTACSGTLADLAVRIGSEKATRNPWLNVTVYGPSGEVLASFPATQ